MRAVVQRVKEGSVAIEGKIHSRIGKGLVVLLGIRKGDTKEVATFLAERCVNLRLFQDSAGKMNLSIGEVGGGVLVDSQFTLYADTLKGNRPGFSDAAQADEAELLYNDFVDRMTSRLGKEKVLTGVFRAMMEVTIVNDGPVTMILEDRENSVKIKEINKRSLNP